MKRFYENDLPLVRASGLSGFAGREKEREERKEKGKKLIPVTLPQKKWEGKITKRILMLRL